MKDFYRQKGAPEHGSYTWQQSDWLLPGYFHYREGRGLSDRYSLVLIRWFRIDWFEIPSIPG